MLGECALEPSKERVEEREGKDDRGKEGGNMREGGREIMLSHMMSVLGCADETPPPCSQPQLKRPEAASWPRQQLTRPATAGGGGAQLPAWPVPHSKEWAPN